jgi:uncharacterized membrane protein YeaQ/YmgE (transglycosylase-associated protein family)
MLGILAVIAIVLLVLYFLTGAVLGIGSLIITVIIWAVIGWLAGQIMKGDGYGALGNILLGIVGGLIGGLIFNILNINLGGIIGHIIVGVVGSIIVIAIGRMLQGRSVTTA